mmetsp:Transcript_3271/g.11449  ORF Transcript_3271/g.11449 Transcript_3271/m.11449 type:complete len:1068 (-) Transcript_3271:367-3570(-)
MSNSRCSGPLAGRSRSRRAMPPRRPRPRISIACTSGSAITASSRFSMATWSRFQIGPAKPRSIRPAMRVSRSRRWPSRSASSRAVQYQPTASTIRLATSAMPAASRVCSPIVIRANAMPSPPRPLKRHYPQSIGAFRASGLGRRLAGHLLGRRRLGCRLAYRLACRFARHLARRLARPGLELEHDLAFLAVIGQEGLELAARLVGDEVLQQVGLALGQQLVHLGRLDGLGQDDLAGLEVAGELLAHRVLADVVGAVLVDMALALGAGAQALLAGEVHRLAVVLGLLGVFAEVELQLPVVDLGVEHQGQFGREGPAGLGAEALQRADLLGAQELLHLGQLEAAAAGDLADGKTTGVVATATLARAGEAAVVLLHHTTALRARRLQRRVVARDGVAVVALGLGDHLLGHGCDLGHELLALQLALLHRGELGLPVAGQLGLGQVLDLQAAQQRHQLEGLGGRDQLAALAQHVLFADQAFDGGRARGWRAQALLGHGLAQLVVIDQLAGAFHRGEQRRFGVARRRLGLQGLHVDALGAHDLARLHRHEVGVLVVHILAVDGQPARLHQHLAVGLEVMGLAGGLHLADAGRDQELGRREEHRQEALDHQVVELGLDLGQRLGRLQRRDDGEVVRHLAVVEHLLGGLDVAVVQRHAGVGGQRLQRAGQVLARDHLGRLLGHGQVVLGQEARVGPRVGQHLVLFVQRLRDGQRRLGREAEARVGLALQRGQVVERAATGGAGLAFLGDVSGLAEHGLGDLVGLGRVPQPVGAALGIVVLLPGRVEPLALVLAGLRIEVGAQLPVVAGDVLADLLLALDDDGQRRRLHPADRGQEEAAVARVEGRHRPRAVDADQPIGLGAAARGVGQRQHLLVAAQLLEALADGGRRHRLQPQPLDRFVQRPLGRLRVLLDQAEDQFALAARVAGVDQGRDVLAADQLDEGVQPALVLVDRVEVEVRRDHRQMGEAPLATLDVELLGRGDLHQMAHGRADDVVLVLEVVVMLVELARHGGQRADDVLRHAGLLGNDQCLAHRVVSLRSSVRQETRYPLPTIRASRARPRTRAPMKSPYHRADDR